MTTSVLGIDLGTTETKVGLLDMRGMPIALARAGYDLSMPQPAWAEQEVEHWWRAIVHATRQVMSEADEPPIAISVVGQGPTVVATDETRRALRPAITWMDRRATEEVAELQRTLSTSAFGLGVIPTALWLSRYEPDVLERTRYLLMSWDYMAYRMCGTAVSSGVGSGRPVGDLTRIGLAPTFVAHSVAWGTPVGRLLPDVAAELLLPAGVPVVSGSNDALATFFGAGLSQRGQAVDTGGTSGGFAVYWDEVLEIPGAISSPAPVRGLQLYGGMMSASGKSLDWLSKVVGSNTGGVDGASREAMTVEILLEEADRVPPAAEGLVFLPYLAGERSPIWDEDARGAFLGLSLRHGRGHLTRAVIEAAALAIRHVAQPIRDAGVTVDEMRVCGGPARSSVWNQVKADVTGFVVSVPRVVDSAVVGAAMLAAVGVGAKADIETAIADMASVDHVVWPRNSTRKVYDELFGAYKDAYPAMKPVLQQLLRAERSEIETRHRQ